MPQEQITVDINAYTVNLEMKTPEWVSRMQAIIRIKEKCKH